MIRHAPAPPPLAGRVANLTGFYMSNMTDETAKAARLLKVVDAVVAEFERQGVAEALADLRFDALQLAEVGSLRSAG